MSDNVYFGKSWRFERTLEDGSIDRLELIEKFALLQYGGFGLPPVEWRTQPSLQGIGERVLDYQVGSRSVTFEIASLDNASQLDLDQARLRLVEFAKPNQVEPVRVVVTRTDGRQFALHVRPLEAASFAGESVGPGFLEQTTWVAHDPIWFDPNPVIIELPRPPRSDARSMFVLQSENRNLMTQNMAAGEDLRYFWNFGDGTYSNEREPIKRYSQDGTFRVRLTVYNEFSSHTTARDVMIEDRIMVPDAPDRPSLRIRDGAIDLTWMMPNGNGDGPRSYLVRWRRVGTGSFSERRVTVLEYTIPNLLNGVEYEVEIIATNIRGDSQPSPRSRATPAARPAQPPAPTLVIGFQSITATISRLPDSGGSPLHTSRVRYKRSSEDESRWIVRTLSEAQYSANNRGGEITIANLENGVSYDVQWRVANEPGASPWSPTSSIAPGAAPDRVAAPQFQAGSQRITAAWAVPNNHGYPVLDYRVRWAAAAAPTTYLNPAGATGEEATQQRYVISNLENGVPYIVEVAARNAVGIGSFSSPAGETPGTFPARMSAPTLTAGFRSLLVEWTIPTAIAQTGGSPITSVDLEWRVGTSGDFTPIIGLTGTSHRLTQLTNGDMVQVRIRPTNRFGDAPQWSQPAQAEVGGVPDRMAAPTLTRGDGQATATWVAPADGGRPITSYELQYKQSVRPDSDFQPIIGLTDLSHVIPNLSNGVQYDVQVRARSVRGPGEWSPTAMIVPAGAPDKPGIPMLTRDGSRRVLVEWTLPAHNGDPISSTDLEWVDADSTTMTVNNIIGTSQLLSGLTDGKSIMVRVRVTNSVNDSPWSDFAAIIVGNLPDQPARPTTARDGDNIIVTWVLPSGNGLPILRTDLQWRVTGEREWNHIRNLDGTSYTFTPQRLDVVYEFRVASANAVDYGPWSPIAIGSTRPVPQQVMNVRAAVGSGYLFVEWDAAVSARSAVLYYELQTTIGGVSRTITPVSRTYYVLDGLTNEEAVTITVAAGSTDGLGQASDPLTATPSAHALDLMSFTSSDDDDARFLLEITNDPVETVVDRELYNDDSDPPTGIVTLGDISLPPRIDRIRLAANQRLVFNRDEGETALFSDYRTSNPTHELNCAYLRNRTTRVYYFTLSVRDSAGGGQGFLYFEDLATRDQGNLRALAPGDKMLFVFGPINTVSLQNVRPDPPALLSTSVSGSAITVTYALFTNPVLADDWLIEYKRASDDEWLVDIVTASDAGGTHQLSDLAPGDYEIRMRGRNSVGASVATDLSTATVS